MVNPKNAHNDDREHAHDQVQHNVEVGLKGKLDSQIFVGKGFEGEGDRVWDGLLTSELLRSHLFNLIEIHLDHDKHLVVQTLLEVGKVQNDVTWQKSFVAATIFWSHRQNFHLIKLLVHHVFVVAWLNYQIEKWRAPVNFKPARQRS